MDNRQTYIHKFKGEAKGVKNKIILETDYNAEKIGPLLKNTDTISFLDLITEYNILIQKDIF